MEEIIKLIQEKAKERLVSQKTDFCVYDVWGSNVDDAFWGGVDEGERFFAKALLKKLEDNNLI